MLSSGVDIQSVPMPEWWPIFRPGLEVAENQILIHMLIPLIVALGYSDFSQTELPKTKARRSALLLSVYSLALLGLSFLANVYAYLAILPVLFAPLGHELVVYLGRRREKGNQPVFLGEDGVMVLTVYPDSPAEKMGLQVGGVIRSVNGVETTDFRDLAAQMSPWIIDPVLMVENRFQQPAKRQVSFKGKIPPLGIVPAPHPEQGAYVRFKDGFLKSLWKKWNPKRK